MDSFEFLGGRYNRPEQIMSGPMQSFRAQSAATGRTVFIHRVSTTEAPEEQAALLKLLSSALVKSAEVKRLVLDFGEDRGHWYVVTDSDPQCALLRDWLQAEIDSAAKSAVLPSTAPAAPAPIIPAAPPGEFTSFFKKADIEQKPAPQVPIATAPSPAPTAAPEQQPGEFTRFFNPGLPQAPAQPRVPKPAPSPVLSAVQRPAHSPFVQRPNSPVPPSPPKTPDNGEFTKLFSVPAKAENPPPLPRRDPIFQPNAEGETLFSDKIDVGKPLPSSKPAVGEFTQMFGSVGAAAPPVQPAAVVAQPRQPSPVNDGPKDSRLLTTQPVSAVPVKPQESEATAPSEFTRIMQGGFAKPNVAEPAAPKPVPPKAPPPPLPAPAPQAAAGNKKMLIFFAILGVLAVVFILLMMFVMKK
jgi:hypothetical protein